MNKLKLNGRIDQLQRRLDADLAARIERLCQDARRGGAYNRWGGESLRYNGWSASELAEVVVAAWQEGGLTGAYDDAGEPGVWLADIREMLEREGLDLARPDDRHRLTAIFEQEIILASYTAGGVRHD